LVQAGCNFSIWFFPSGPTNSLRAFATPLVIIIILYRCERARRPAPRDVLIIVLYFCMCIYINQFISLDRTTTLPRNTFSCNWNRDTYLNTDGRVKASGFTLYYHKNLSSLVQSIGIHDHSSEVLCVPI